MEERLAMRKLSENEVLSLTALLDMEKNGMLVARAMQVLTGDDELKKQSEAGILAMEGRIKGLQQFITENQVTDIKEVQ
jgi:phosphopantetheine adenylyltransferase